MTSMRIGSRLTASNQICLKLSLIPNEIWLHCKFIGFSAELTDSLVLGTKLEKPPSVIAVGPSACPLQRHNFTNTLQVLTVPDIPIVQSRASSAWSACENRGLHPQAHCTRKEHGADATWTNMKATDLNSGAQQHKAPLKELCFDIHEFSNLAQVTWYRIKNYETAEKACSVITWCHLAPQVSSLTSLFA